MTQIGRQPDHLARRVLARPVPAHHRAHREGVAKVVDARSPAMSAVLLRRAQAVPLAHLREVVACAAVGQPRSLFGNEERRRGTSEHRHRLRYPDIDQVLREPASKMVEADLVVRPTRLRPRQPVRKIRSQRRGLDAGSVHQLPQFPGKMAIGFDRPRFVIGSGKALRERVQIRIDAGLQISRRR